jgi:hypothetical protein
VAPSVYPRAHGLGIQSTEENSQQVNIYIYIYVYIIYICIYIYEVQSTEMKNRQQVINPYIKL